MYIEVHTTSLVKVEMQAYVTWIHDYNIVWWLFKPESQSARPMPGIRVPVDERLLRQWNVRPGIVNVPGRTPVVKSNNQLAVISAAARACTFCVVAFREWTIIGSVSYQNRYRVYRIESYWLLLYCGKPDITCITARSAAVNGSHYTGRSKCVRPSPIARATFDRPQYGRWLEEREEEGECNL